MNWLNLLTNALKVGVALKSISDVDNWINEKISELSYDSTFNSALVEIAYEVAKMDNDTWQYLQAHLGIKAINNENATYFLNYCNYVVQLENTTMKDLLSYDIREAWDILSINIRSMKNFEVAAYFGILSAYSENNMKARGLAQSFQRLLS